MMATSSVRVVCPGCGQGWVVPVRVRSSGVHLAVCEECETTWFLGEDIGSARPMNFLDYMESNGLKGLWTEVERLPFGGDS